MGKLKDKKNLTKLSAFLVIPTLLVIIWFSHGNILGTGESGLPFYDFELQLNINQEAWASYALGHPTNISIASKPTYWIFAILQKAGIPGFLLQAFFFWLVLVLSGGGVYLLTKELFPKLSYKYLFIAVLFYWFNPFSLVNIWNRFLNNFFVFYALLPIAWYLFIRGLNQRKYVFGILIGITSIFFSYALTSMAFILILWFLLFFTALFYAIFQNNWKDRLYIVRYFGVTLVFWLLINAWWINQVFSYVYSGSFGKLAEQYFSSGENYTSFTLLSERLGNVGHLFRLKHTTFYQVPDVWWASIYNFPALVFIEFAVIGMILLAVIFSRKDSRVLFLLTLLILSIFMAKGNNPPLGEIFDSLFNNFFVFQLFRNPFEKFGFLLQLAFAPLSAFGLYQALSYKKILKLGNLIYATFFFWLVAIWGYPYWTGIVFVSHVPPTDDPKVGFQVKVPRDYESASKWLSENAEDYRLIAFPLGGEGITYLWDKGYSGVELTNQLLPVTAVSFNTNILFYDDLSKSLEKEFLETDDFNNVAGALNAKYIMVRSDIDWRGRLMRSPDVLHEYLKRQEEKGKVKNVANFGKLSFWEILGGKQGKVFADNGVTLAYPQSKISDFKVIGHPTVFYSSEYQKNPGNEMLSEIVIHPEAKFSYGSKGPIAFKSNQHLFPHTRFSPTDQPYKLVLLKERLESIVNRDPFQLIQSRLSLLGKRLVEIDKELSKHNREGVKIALLGYKKISKDTERTFEYVSKRLDLDDTYADEDLYQLLTEHLRVIDTIKNTFPDDLEMQNLVSDVYVEVKNLLMRSKVLPTFNFKEDNRMQLKNRISYQFNVLTPGNYELVWGKSNWGKYYELPQDGKMLLQLDNEILQKDVVVNNDGTFSYGTLTLSEGIHEIGTEVPGMLNLVNFSKELSLIVDHEAAEEKSEIKDFDPNTTYLLTFDYRIDKGSGFEVSIETDNGTVKDGLKIPDFAYKVQPDVYDFSTKRFSWPVKLNQNASSATLKFKAFPWNDCESIYYQRKDKCKDINLKRLYDRTTEVTLSNVSVKRLLTDRPTLINRVKAGNKTVLPKLSYKKIRATEYLVDIQDAKDQFLLVFSELYDPGWKLLVGDNQLSTPHFLANAYANGWVVDKAGDYQIRIKYIPQDLLNAGKAVSLITFIAGGIYTFMAVRNKHEKSN